jgi:hypothetical protein
VAEAALSWVGYGTLPDRILARPVVALALVVRVRAGLTGNT